MAHTLGALQLPATDEPDIPLTDPGLAYLAEFLAAIANYELQSAWELRAPLSEIVNQWRVGDPSKGVYVDNWTGALFVWRGPHHTVERIADEWEVILTRVRALYVFEPVQVEQYDQRQFVTHGLTAALTKNLYLGRCPAWTVDGDTDTTAATRGSSLLKWCGFDQLLFTGGEETTLNISVDESQLSYAAFALTMDVRETIRIDASLLGSASHLTATIDQGPGGFQQTISQ